MNVEHVKDWLRRRGWLAVDRWLMPDVGAELARLDVESPRLQRRLARRAKLQPLEHDGHQS
jgi:hypothetical protein